MDVSMIRRRVGAIWLPSTCCMERRVPWLRAKPTCRLSGQNWLEPTRIEGAGASCSICTQAPRYRTAPILNAELRLAEVELRDCACFNSS
jgi:hypothetical protein